MIMHSLSPKKHAYPTFYCKFISFEFPCLKVKFFKIYNVIENQVLDPFSEWIFICYEKSPRKLRESVHVQVYKASPFLRKNDLIRACILYESTVTMCHYFTYVLSYAQLYDLELYLFYLHYCFFQQWYTFFALWKHV